MFNALIAPGSKANDPRRIAPEFSNIPRSCRQSFVTQVITLSLCIKAYHVKADCGVIGDSSLEIT
jgi:hypothetical protein